MTTDVKATYRDALAVPEFRAIYISHVMSMLGTVMTDFALTVLIYSRTGSPLLSALVFALGLTLISLWARCCRRSWTGCPYGVCW